MPPAAPPGVCLETCDWSRDGHCDDPGGGSKDDPLCSLGTDCEDCSVRPFCTSCPESCIQYNLGLTDPTQACMEYMWSDEVCDDACNVMECFHNDCSNRQAVTACIDKHDRIGLDMTTVSAWVSGSQALPMVLELELPTFAPVLNEHTNRMQVAMEITWSMTYLVPTLYTTPCAIKMPYIMSLSMIEGLSDQLRSQRYDVARRFWAPFVDGVDLKPGFDVLPEAFQFTWTIGGPGSTRPEQWEAMASAGALRETAIGQFSGSSEFDVVQHFDYYYYPFDVQQIKITLKMEGTNITNCEMLEGVGMKDSSYPLAKMGLTPDNVQAALLGEDGSLWSVRGGLHSVKVERPLKNGQPVVDSCSVIIDIERNYIVYTVKHLTLNMLLVLGSIVTAQSLSADENTGDRCAVLFLALLILFTAMQEDLGLGTVTYLMWLDYFFACQFLMVMLCLLMTVVVHRLATHQQHILARHIDTVSNKAIPLLVYPVVSGGTILLGLDSICPGAKTAGVVVLCVGIPAMLVYVSWRVWHNILRCRIMQSKAIAAFRYGARHLRQDDDASKTRFSTLCRNLLYSFDIDRSGDIDADEMTEVAKNVFSEYQCKQVHAACVEARKYADKDGRYGAAAPQSTAKSSVFAFVSQWDETLGLGHPPRCGLCFDS